MLRDAREIEDGTLIECDVCIVGAGAAGITIARELAAEPVRTCLLESGGLDFEAAIQDLYRGENGGRPYDDLDLARLRYFGGTTNHWTGRCVPLDPIDFEARDWLPHSGWPISRADLDPFYARAHEVCRLGPFEYQSRLRHPDEQRALALDGRRLRHLFWRENALPFGATYRAELEAAERVDVVLHASVTEIEATDAVSAVERVVVRTLDGRRLVCRARRYVLACGGIENARLLLASNRQARGGLGNAHGNVGRYFMEHLVTPAGRAVVFDPEAFSTLYWVQDAPPTMPEGLRFLDCLATAPEQMRARQIPSIAWRFYDQDDPERDPVNGYAGLRRLVRRLRRFQVPHDLAGDLAQMAADIDGTVAGLLDRVGLISHDYVPATCTVSALSEQVPNATSRVSLSTERDALGVPRARLEWRLTDLDKRTVRIASRILAEEFGRTGIGRVQLADWLQTDHLSWPEALKGAYHHMGTTRMSADQKQGVVDADCRVHGLDNLYVAGSSVFPTAGWANPTLTIVALALRLADHLKAEPSS